MCRHAYPSRPPRGIAVALLLVLSAGARAAWTDDLDALLAAKTAAERDRLIASIASAHPDWKAVTDRLQRLAFPEVERGKAVVRQLPGPDGVTRTFALYVPGSYDPGRPTPMLVWLHGAVTRPTLQDNPGLWAGQHVAARLAESRGWLCLFPLGQAGATWWDATGMANIRNAVRAAKREANVDDDRVWLGGFSDGASGAFLASMTAPSDYAAFVALNGHMGAGSLIGKIPAYLAGFGARPAYAVTTDRDNLFPSAVMEGSILAANRAGGHILYRQREGIHELSYWADEAPLIARFLERHPRDPFPPRVVWETSDPAFGRCDWLAIDAVAEGRKAAWHEEQNPTIREVHATLGIVPDPTYTERGVPVKGVLDGSPAQRAGLKAGDILTRVGTVALKDATDLDAFEAGLQRETDVELAFRRNDREQVVTAQMPGPQEYPLLFHDKPSAMVRASFAANRVEIEGSRLGAFRVFVHPDMVRLEQPLVVRVNGKTVYNARVEPDIAFLLRGFLENRDRRLLYIAELKLQP